jgi:DNA repair photolyase
MSALAHKFDAPPLLSYERNNAGPISPTLVGIARLAAEGESIRLGHEVEYLTLPARSLLNKCNTPRMPFTWTINPYRGCEFACKYCYARYTHEFMELRDNTEFERKIFVKQQASNLLRHDLRKVKTGEEIAIGTATDPYQPAERRYEVTRGILEEFALHRGFAIGIITKSQLILRDLELLRRIGENNQISVNITITTLDANLARILEPRAPRPDLRLNAIKILNDAGIPCGVSCAPVLPGITDRPRDLDSLVAAARSHGARSIFANPLFLKPCSASVFMPFLEKEFPHLAENYRKRYGKSAFVPDAYRQRVQQLMSSLKRKHGFPAHRQRYEERRPVVSVKPDQLALFA